MEKGIYPLWADVMEWWAYRKHVWYFWLVDSWTSSMIALGEQGQREAEAVNKEDPVRQLVRLGGGRGGGGEIHCLWNGQVQEKCVSANV